MEIEFKGTKGQWKFDSDNMKIKGTGDYEGLTVIANVSPMMNYSRGMTTQSANAKLISCAPEMLEMLESIFRLQKDNYGNGMETHIALIQKANEIEQLLIKTKK